MVLHLFAEVRKILRNLIAGKLPIQPLDEVLYEGIEGHIKVKNIVNDPTAARLQEKPIANLRGYFVDTVGKNAKKIEEYIKHQLDEDKLGEQMSIPGIKNPFTGSK